MSNAQPVIQVDANGVPIAPPGGLQAVNLTQVAGSAVALGPDSVLAGSNSVPVVFPTGYTMAISGSVTSTMGALVAGTAIIGKVGIDQTTPGTTNGVQVNAALPAGTNVIGKTSIDQTTNGTTNAVQVVLPIAANTPTMYHATVPNNTTGVVVKASAGVVYGIQLSNTSTSVPGVLHLYNASSAPTAGAGTVIKALLVPGASAGTGGGGMWRFPYGIAFATGISYTFTTGVADTDTGTPAALTYSINIDYL